MIDYELLRVYYYDAPPSAESIKYPISGNRLNLATTTRFKLSQALYDQLILKRNFALRMGRVALLPNKWRIKPVVAKALIKAPRPLTDNDFDLEVEQKGVDMRVGLDMARLALREMNTLGSWTFRGKSAAQPSTPTIRHPVSRPCVSPA